MTEENDTQTTSSADISSSEPVTTEVVNKPVKEAKTPEKTTEETKEQPKKISRRDAIKRSIKAVSEKLNNETDKSVQGNKGKETKEFIDAEARESSTDENKESQKSEEITSQEEGQTSEQVIQAPQVYSAEEKQEFNKLPASIKPAVARFTANIFNTAQRHINEAVQAKNAYGGVYEAVKPYLNEWNLRGTDAPTAVRNLAAIWDDLHKRGAQAWIELMPRVGVNPQEVQQLLGGNGQQQQNNSTNLQNHPLTNEVNSLKTQLTQLTQQQQQAQTHALRTEFMQGLSEAQSEVDSAGNYTHPQLHDAAYYQHIAPLVIKIKRDDPRVSWKQAQIQAHRMVQGAAGVNLGTTQQQSPQISKRVVTPISVKTRGAIPAQTQIPIQAKKGEKRSDTIRRAAQLIRAQRQAG